MSSTLAASSSSTTSSPRCVPAFAFRRRGGARGRLPAPASAARTVVSSTHGGGGCGRPLCCAAEGIQSAFFASLDVCSCVKVRTDSFKEYSESEAAPLMSSSTPPPHDDSGGSGRRIRASAAAGKPRRGLVGCCTPSSTSVVN